jgi:hypothetical protein
MAAGCEFAQWTDWIVAPGDLATCVLEWGRVPSFVLVAISVVTALSAWREFGRNRARELSTARRRFVERTTGGQRVAVRLCLSGAVILVATYALSRLAETLFRPHDGARSLFSEMFDDENYVVGNPVAWIVGSPHWTSVTTWAVLGSVLAAGLLVYACLTRTAGMRGLVRAAVWLVCVPLAGLAFLCVIAALGNLLFEDRAAAQPLPLFFSVWAAAMFALVWGWMKFETATGEL